MQPCSPERVCRTVPKMRFTASSGFAAPCTDAPLGINSPQSRQPPRPGLATRENLAQSAPHDCRRFFCVRSLVPWRLCVGDLRVCRVPSSRFANLRTAATQLFGDDAWQLQPNLEFHACFSLSLTGSSHPLSAAAHPLRYLDPIAFSLFTVSPPAT